MRFVIKGLEITIQNHYYFNYLYLCLWHNTHIKTNVYINKFKTLQFLIYKCTYKFTFKYLHEKKNQKNLLFRLNYIKDRSCWNADWGPQWYISILHLTAEDAHLFEPLAGPPAHPTVPPGQPRPSMASLSGNSAIPSTLCLTGPGTTASWGGLVLSKSLSL